MGIRRPPAGTRPDQPQGHRLVAWWRASQREGPGVSFWAEAEARYYLQLDALVRAALGPLSSDEDAVAVVITVFGRWVIGSLQEAGRTSKEAQSLVSDLLATWLETRSPPDR